MKRRVFLSTSLTAQALLLVCTLGVIWGGIAVHLRQEYARALLGGENRTANIARAFEETVSRSIAVMDQALEHVRDLYSRDPEHFTLDHWLNDKTVLRDISVQLAIVDANGMTTTTTVGRDANVNISDREHFQVQVSAPEDRLFVSKPVIGRASGKLSIQLSRRVTDRDGHFAGVVVASLDPRVLGVFRESSNLEEGFATLIGRDGVIRSERPESAVPGASVLPPPNPEMARMFQDDASAETETAIGPEAIVSYRGVTGYPLFVAVGLSRHAAFASYEAARRDTILAGMFVSLIVVLVGLVTLTQRYRLARFHRALTLTLENISQGILMIDKRRRLPVANRRVAELLGLPPELARPGADFDALVEWQRQHGEFRADLTGDPRIAAMVDEGGIDPNMAFYERTRADGTVLEIRTTILPDGGAVRTFTDVTERKRIEREMAQARDAAEAGVRARTEFLAVISHEIRTPINGIIGATGLLRDMRLTSEQTEYVRIIRECSDHLAALIENILDFSRLDRGRLELEEAAFDPRALLQAVIAMLSDQAKAKGITLIGRIAGDLPERVSGDALRLRQILINLIGNGIKFTKSGGVTVEAWIDDAGPQTVALAVMVTDTGIGIDLENQKKLYSAFTQADGSISRQFDGTGLGLAICARLVTLMGGEIAVDSVPGRGSAFRFSVQLRRVAEAMRGETLTKGARPPARHLKVLLAEDNPTNRHVASRMLVRMGHTVDAVEDGALAVSAAAASDYDVILMDMMMPEVDGLAATRMIRAGAPPHCHVRIIGLTANVADADRAACMAAGMNDFVGKPVTLDRLRAVLDQTAGEKKPVADEAGLAPILDAEFLKQLADGIGAASVAEVMRAFLEDAPVGLATIRRALKDGAAQTIRREAHQLSGAARNVGLTRLGEAASRLQAISAVSPPDPEAIETVAAALRDAQPLAAAWADAHEKLTTGIG